MKLNGDKNTCFRRFFELLLMSDDEKPKECRVLRYFFFLSIREKKEESGFLTVCTLVTLVRHAERTDKSLRIE